MNRATRLPSLEAPETVDEPRPEQRLAVELRRGSIGDKLRLVDDRLKHIRLASPLHAVIVGVKPLGGRRPHERGHKRRHVIARLVRPLKDARLNPTLLHLEKVKLHDTPPFASRSSIS